MNNTKLDGKSIDIVEENKEILKNLFPEIVTEDKINFNKLKELLGEDIEEKDEFYDFTWEGKTEAYNESQIPITKTLRPKKEESKNWDTTKNLYIEGDNLETLKILEDSYRNKIKMIYIDPPYNTGGDFVYNDKWNETTLEHLKNTNQLSEDGLKISTNTKKKGRFHSKWLNMIYPRLIVGRRLLTEDGVIFISIDDNEEYNLKKICDEVFGEENFISNIIWEKNFAPKNDNKYISISHEYALCYAKVKNKFKRNLLPRNEKHNKGYKNFDQDKRGLWSSGTMLATTFSEKYVFGIKKPNNEIAYPPKGKCWRYSKNKIDDLIKDNRIWFGKDGSNVPRVKRFLSEVPNGIVPQSLWKHVDVGNNQNATNDLKKIFDGKTIFSFPKPVEYIKQMIHIGTNKNDIILDFFSGSGTTAHSVMQLNLEDGGNRNFIMVQIPELTDKKSEANKSNYKNIFDIGKDRIKKAGDKILKESENNDLDIGFKVFKVDESNFLPWNPEKYDDIQEAVFENENNLVDGRTELDFIYELILKMGLDLTVPIDKKELNNHLIYIVNRAQLLICLDKSISESIVDDLVQIKEDYFSEVTSVILKDEGLTDELKLNIVENLKVNGINDFNTI